MKLYKLTYQKEPNVELSFSGYYKSPLIARLHFSRIHKLNILQAKQIAIKEFTRVPETQTFLDFLQQPLI